MAPLVTTSYGETPASHAPQPTLAVTQAARGNQETEPINTPPRSLPRSKSDTRRDIIAYIAMAFSFLAFVPSLIVIFRNKSSCNISITGIVLRIVSMCLWVYFALANNIIPTLVSGSALLFALMSFLAVVMYFQVECVEH